MDDLNMSGVSIMLVVQCAHCNCTKPCETVPQMSNTWIKNK